MEPVEHIDNKGTDNPTRPGKSLSGNRNRRQQIKSVVIVASGNFLEAYDFIVFGYYATFIGRAFFPARSESASLMLALMTFGAGFLMRPLGAILLGAYMDRQGRRAGLLLTLGLMAAGTASIAITPAYATIGLLATGIVVIGRLLQGFSAGAESAGVSVYLAEIATPGHKGFYVAWQSASNQVAVIFAALLGILVNVNLSHAQMGDWGWRVPLVVGCMVIPFIFLLQGSLKETDEFLGRRRRATMREIARSLSVNWALILSGTMMATLMTVGFYLITTYTPTYGNAVLKLSTTLSMAVTLCVGVSNFVLLPVMGSLSDKVGRRPLLIVFSSLAILTGYPALSWLVSSPGFERLLVVELWFALLYAGYNGAMVVYLTEVMPPQVRTAGFSIAYSVATALFGGFTPAICTSLIQTTGNRAMPGAWLSVAAIIALAGVLGLAGRARDGSVPLQA